MNTKVNLLRSVVADFCALNRGRKGTLSRFAIAFANRGLSALILYRLAHSLQGKLPLLPYLFTRASQLLYGVDIDPKAELGPGIVLVHCNGLVIGSCTRIAGNCVIFHGVTFGDRGSEWVGSNQPDGHPTIGNGCIFGAGSKILGDIRIEDNCVVGANAVVVNTVPRNSVVAGIPARIISKRPIMDENLRPVAGHRDDRAKSPLEYTDR